MKLTSSNRVGKQKQNEFDFLYNSIGNRANIGKLRRSKQMLRSKDMLQSLNTMQPKNMSYLDRQMIYSVRGQAPFFMQTLVPKIRTSVPMIESKQMYPDNHHTELFFNENINSINTQPNMKKRLLNKNSEQNGSAFLLKTYDTSPNITPYRVQSYRGSSSFHNTPKNYLTPSSTSPDKNEILAKTRQLLIKIISEDKIFSAQTMKDIRITAGNLLKSFDQITIKKENTSSLELSNCDLEQLISKHQLANIMMYVRLNDGQSQEMEKCKRLLANLYKKYQLLEKIVQTRQRNIFDKQKKKLQNQVKLLQQKIQNYKYKDNKYCCKYQLLFKQNNQESCFQNKVKEIKDKSMSHLNYEQLQKIIVQQNKVIQQTHFWAENQLKNKSEIIKINEKQLETKQQQIKQLKKQIKVQFKDESQNKNSANKTSKIKQNKNSSAKQNQNATKNVQIKEGKKIIFLEQKKYEKQNKNKKYIIDQSMIQKNNTAVAPKKQMQLKMQSQCRAIEYNKEVSFEKKNKKTATNIVPEIMQQLFKDHSKNEEIYRILLLQAETIQSRLG